MSQLFACAYAVVARDRKRRHGDRSHLYFNLLLDTNNAVEWALLYNCALAFWPIRPLPLCPSVSLLSLVALYRAVPFGVGTPAPCPVVGGSPAVVFATSVTVLLTAYRTMPSTIVMTRMMLTKAPPLHPAAGVGPAGTGGFVDRMPQCR